MNVGYFRRIFHSVISAGWLTGPEIWPHLRQFASFGVASASSRDGLGQPLFHQNEECNQRALERAALAVGYTASLCFASHASQKNLTHNFLYSY